MGRKLGIWTVICLLFPGAWIYCQYLPSGSAAVPESKKSNVVEWFRRYDEVRHQAQMSDGERSRAKGLMSQSVLAALGKNQPAEDKAAASALLRKLVERYHTAESQLSSLPTIGETKKLQKGYLQYFSSASSLFSDYLKVQNNLFATDASGNALLGQLQQRKATLEQLDDQNKELDARLRHRFSVPAYAF